MSTPSRDGSVTAAPRAAVTPAPRQSGRTGVDCSYAARPDQRRRLRRTRRGHPRAHRPVRGL